MSTETSSLQDSFIKLDSKYRLEHPPKEHIEKAISNLKLLSSKIFSAQQYYTNSELETINTWSWSFFGWGTTFNPKVIKHTFKTLQKVLNSTDELWSSYQSDIELSYEAALNKIKKIANTNLEKPTIFKSLCKILDKFSFKTLEGNPLEIEMSLDTVLNNLKQLSEFEVGEKPLTDDSSLTIQKDLRPVQIVTRKVLGGFNRAILERTVIKAVQVSHLLPTVPAFVKRKADEIKQHLNLALVGIEKIAETYKNDNNSDMEKAIVAILEKAKLIPQAIDLVETYEPPPPPPAPPPAPQRLEKKGNAGAVPTQKAKTPQAPAQKQQGDYKPTSRDILQAQTRLRKVIVEKKPVEQNALETLFKTAMTRRRGFTQT